LLDHELAALCGCPPVHLAQRLALLVLADRVQVEAGRSPQEHAPTGLGRTARLREDAIELDEAREDEERRLRTPQLLGARERERILEDRAHGLEAVPAAAHRREDVADEERHASPVQLHAAVAETRDSLVHIQ